MEAGYSKAVIYCRVSTEKQVTEGNGLDSQEHRCREYARSLGLEVESVFRDEGISGGLFERPAVKALLKYLDGHWQSKYVVIFDDLKRFARDVEVHIRLKSELKAREASLRCLNYNFDDSAEGEFVETIFAAQNQLERKQNRRQVCQKMKDRMERGYWCFIPPTGYEYLRDRQHGKLLFPIRPLTDIVAEGLNAFAENRILTQADLCRFFINKKLHVLRGVSEKRITIEYVKGLLTQPVYAGIVEYPQWGISRRKGRHKAIISEETYEKIQRKLSRPDRTPRETDSLEFPLRRVVDCALCGKKLTGSVSKGCTKYYPHYTCNNKECIASPKNIDTLKVEEDYVRMLESITIDRKALELARVVALRIWQQKVADSASGQTDNEKEIKDANKQIDEYAELIHETRLVSLRVRYEAKVEELEQCIRELRKVPETKKEPNFEEALDLALKMLGTPAETWNSKRLKLKTLLHGLIFPVNPSYSLKGGFGTPSLSLPFYIKDHLGTEKSIMVDPTGFEPVTSSVPRKRSTK